MAAPASAASGVASASAAVTTAMTATAMTAAFVTLQLLDPGRSGAQFARIAAMWLVVGSAVAGTAVGVALAMAGLFWLFALAERMGAFYSTRYVTSQT